MCKVNSGIISVVNVDLKVFDSSRRCERSQPDVGHLLLDFLQPVGGISPSCGSCHLSVYLQQLGLEHNSTPMCDPPADNLY